MLLATLPYLGRNSMVSFLHKNSVERRLGVSSHPGYHEKSHGVVSLWVEAEALGKCPDFMFAHRLDSVFGKSEIQESFMGGALSAVEP